MKALQGLVCALCFLGILLLGVLSLVEHYEPPITDYDVERLMIPLPSEVWHDEDKRLPE